MNAITRFMLTGSLLIATHRSQAQLATDPFGNATSGQTILNGSPSIINQYFGGVSAVSGSTSFTITPAGTILQGTRVLIIQMIGNTTFAAGTCEWARIDAAGTGFTSPLQNSYNSAGNNRAQIVTVPEYFDLIITGRISCADWDGNTGAVLVFNVKNRLIISAPGFCDVAGKGFKTGSAGAGGSGGSGGNGGIGGSGGMNSITAGTNGANNGTAFWGIAGGGNGALYGSAANNILTPATVLSCPGCGLHATNTSAVSINSKKIIMGGAGQSGDGGFAGAGAGGGGGGGGGSISAGTDGEPGANGGNGGTGGNGGNGGGIIIFTAPTATIDAGIKFIYNGTIATNGTNGTNGGKGGNGGHGGGGCTVGGGGGGGRGADGGKGGNAGNGGAGGMLYYVYANQPYLTNASVNKLGGNGGLSGTGGNGGVAGISGGNAAGENCSIPDPNPGSNCHLSESGVCDFMCCLNALYNMRIGGASPGIYTPADPQNCHATYSNNTASVFIEQVSPTEVLITTGNCYIRIWGTVSPFNSINKIFTAGLNTYSTFTDPASGATIGTLLDGLLSFHSSCGGSFSGSSPPSPSPGNNGGDGLLYGDPAIINCSGFSLVNIPSNQNPCDPPTSLSNVLISGGVFPYATANIGVTLTGNMATVTCSPNTPRLITITDFMGCSASVMVPCMQIPQTVCTKIIFSQNVSCFGVNDGTITCTGSCTPPVNSPVTYTVTGVNGTVYGPTTHSSGSTTTGLAGGSYSVTVTGTCPTNSIPPDPSIIIYSPAAPITISSTVIQPLSCTNINTGAINLIVTGGTPDAYQILQSNTPQPTTGPVTYTYLWSNGATTKNLNGLAPGIYTVTVKDQKNCVATGTFTLVNPGSINLDNTTSTNETCNLKNGTATVNVSGGTAPYSYTWNTGQVPQTTNTASGLAAGTYTVTVTDNNGCAATTSVLVTGTTGPNVNATAVNTRCNASTGSVSLVVTGGTIPYSYSWNNGATTQNISGLAPGAYNFTVTDHTGCTATASATVTTMAGPGVTATVIHTTCGSSNGSVTLTVTGDSPVYNYNWSNGATTQNISGLAPGTYSVTVTDPNGCSTTISVTVNNTAGPTATATATDARCSLSNGAVSLVVTGGTAAYTYNWSNGATTQNITGLVPGTYTVLVKDVNGCTATATATVNNIAGPVLTTTITNATCGNTNGMVNLVVTGGTGPYTYLWNNAATTEDITGLAAGNYSVTVKDANACVTVATAIVNNNAGPAVTTMTTHSNCGTLNGAISLVVTGGTAPYTYLWSNGKTTKDISGLRPGVYSVMVKDINGCRTTATATINIIPGPRLTLTATNATCGNANGLVNLAISGGTPPYTYRWNTGATTKNISGLAPGNYTVTVKDRFGCLVSATVKVYNIAGPVVTANTTNATCGNANGAITLLVSGGRAPYTYNWNNGATTQNISRLVAGYYKVVVIDGNGCTIVIYTQVTTTPCPVCACKSKDRFTAGPVILGEDLRVTAICGQPLNGQLARNTPFKFWVPFKVTGANLCNSVSVNAEIRDVNGNLVTSSSGVDISSPLIWSFRQSGKYCITFTLKKNNMVCKQCSFCFNVKP